MLRDALIRYIRFNEGSRSTRYLDTRGIPTIGVGFNLHRPDAPRKLAALGYDFAAVEAGTQSISDAAIDSLLGDDVDAALQAAGKCVSNFDELNDARKAVIVDLIFNLGAQGFSAFKQTIAAIERDDFAAAAADLTASAWAKEVGNRARRDIAAMASGVLAVPHMDAAGDFQLPAPA